MIATMTDRSLGIADRRTDAGPLSAQRRSIEDGMPEATSGPLVPAEVTSAANAASDASTVEPGKADMAPDAVGGAVATDVDVTADLLTETYQTHYTSLLRLAALLLDDLGSCEDVVQEAFIRVHAARGRVREPEKLLAYLRQTVVNLSRSTLRRRLIGLRLLPKPLPDAASAEEGAYDALERDALIQALRGLQRRQREVLVLRYYADLTEAQVATALGVSIGSVKAYGSRGIEALRARMEEHR
nr:SigE family RNA polymerase sigma factor [Actinocrinis puniceicyclus]